MNNIIVGITLKVKVKVGQRSKSLTTSTVKIKGHWPQGQRSRSKVPWNATSSSTSINAKTFLHCVTYLLQLSHIERFKYFKTVIKVEVILGSKVVFHFLLRNIRHDTVPSLLLKSVRQYLYLLALKKIRIFILKTFTILKRVKQFECFVITCT